MIVLTRRECRDPFNFAMTENSSVRLTVEEADRIAREMTGGEVTIVFDGFEAVMRRKNRQIMLPLFDHEMTEATIRTRLADWKNWPPGPGEMTPNDAAK